MTQKLIFEDQLDMIKQTNRSGHINLVTDSEPISSKIRKCLLLDKITRENDVHGIYIVRKMHTSEIIYIGKAGTINSNGKRKKQGLLRRLTNVRKGMTSKKYFDRLLSKFGPLIIEYIIIDDPMQSANYLEAILLQSYLNENNKLPEENEEF